jgi:copper homeostasis protein CutC
MLRTHNDFKYHIGDILKFKKIIKKYHTTNLKGYVFGYLKGNHIDKKHISKLVKFCKPKETVFHMAFDNVVD